MAHYHLKSKKISDRVEPRKLYIISRYVPTCSCILDLGSGKGQYVPFLLKKARSVICVDINRQLCIELYNKGYSAVQTNAMTLPFRQSTFDATFASEVIEHTPSLEQTLTEIERVTRNVIIATLPNPRSPHFKRDPSHIARYSLKSLKSLLHSRKDWQYKIRGLGFHAIPAPSLIKMVTTFILWFLPWLSPTILIVGKRRA